VSDEISPELEAAVVAFHAALDAAGGMHSGHSYDGQFVDGNSYVVVEALLAAGWTPPERTLTEQVAARVSEVLPPGWDVHVHTPDAERG